MYRVVVTIAEFSDVISATPFTSVTGLPLIVYVAFAPSKGVVTTVACSASLGFPSPCFSGAHAPSTLATATTPMARSLLISQPRGERCARGEQPGSPPA